MHWCKGSTADFIAGSVILMSLHQPVVQLTLQSTEHNSYSERGVRCLVHTKHKNGAITPGNTRYYGVDVGPVANVMHT